MSTTKKNCKNCKHLEWVDGEEEGCSGFMCNKPSAASSTITKEDAQLANMERDSYLEKSKVCCVLKVTQ